MHVLPEEEWRARRDAHVRRVEPWVGPRLRRRAEGRTDPVDDFLWEYYVHRPGQLRRWHPGYGVVLTGDAEEYLQHKEYAATAAGVTVSEEALTNVAGTVAGIAELLRGTRSRPATYGCFGMHEWAMVYGLRPGDVRHSSWPLRLEPAEVRAVVDEVGLRCTHFDAYRFFTAEAAPLNAMTPTRATQPDLEQGGCLHANMDLYKWSARLAPFVGSDLVADCFELARDARALDMRAAPYDLRALGLDPLPMETAGGRAEYVVEQRQLAARADVLRERLLAALDGWNPRGTG